MLRRILIILAAGAALLNAAPAAAQDPVFGADSVAIRDTIVPEARVPRNAMIRAVLVPGWGHAYIDAPQRGAVFFALQTTSWYMLLKTLSRLSDVRGVEQRLAALGRDSLHALMAADTAVARELGDPEAFEAALARYPDLADRRLLVRAREQQRQDWITYTLVLTFAAGIDAYVTAHLKEFPGDFIAAPAAGGGARLSMRLPVGGVR